MIQPTRWDLLRIDWQLMELDRELDPARYWRDLADRRACQLVDAQDAFKRERADAERARFQRDIAIFLAVASGGVLAILATLCVAVMQ